MHTAKFAARRNRPESRAPAGTGDVELLTGVTAAIARCLSAQPPVVTIERVAAETGMNVRTLQRRLAWAGCSFRDLREIEYQKMARACLASGTMSVKEISERLGYSHPAHFARAFRRWTGKPPTAYLQNEYSSGG